jgi:plasmid stabilization system protein ParE
MASQRIIRSARVRQDLFDIWRHVDIEAGPQAADSVVARLVEAIYRAADRPLLYRPRRELRGSPRRLNVFRYAIFFEVLPEADGIFVWRVLHGARDLRWVLRRPRFPGEEDA